MIEKKQTLYRFERKDNYTAFGTTYKFKGPGLSQYVNSVHFLQPCNALATEHFGLEEQENEAKIIASLLHSAFEAGRQSMKADLREILEIK